MFRIRIRTCTLALLVGLVAAGGGCTKESSGQASANPPGADPTASAQSGAKVAAPAAPAPAPEGTVYGAGVKGAEAVTIAALLADPAAYAGKTVRVEGTVSDVCPKRGCWFEMAGKEPGHKLRFKVQDGVMVFPMDAKGKYAVAEGVVHAQTLSLEDTRKYLEYQAKEYGKDVDPASVTEPMTVVRLDGEGAVIGEAK